MRFPEFAQATLLVALVTCQAMGQEKTDTRLPESALAEATQADAYMQQSNVAAALPLYEHLAAEFPQKAVYAERLAFCLMSKVETMPPGEAKNALFVRAKSEVARAKALGDNSNLLQLLQERTSGDASQLPSIADPKMQAAEEAFTKGDLDKALGLYQEIAAADPKSYDSRLYAGDVYFKKHDPKQAGDWYQKAIQVDPNRETAYRYWGDALTEDGQKQEALDKFIDALVAEPYNRRPALAINQWAQKNGAVLRVPNIKLPRGPEQKKGVDGKAAVDINIDPSTLKDPNVGAAWMAYSMNRALWQGEKFAKEFPNEKQYRHSLAEEVDSLKMVLTILKEQKVADDKLDAGLSDLRRLGKDGMLEPFVLLNAADSGIAQDYAAYRDQHRDQLHAYIKKYIVHQNGEGK